MVHLVLALNLRCDPIANRRIDKLETLRVLEEVVLIRVEDGNALLASQWANGRARGPRQGRYQDGPRIGQVIADPMATSAVDKFGEDLARR